MKFNKFVEIGRIIVVTNEKYNGKIGAVVNVLDQNRVLVDGPVDLTGLPRIVINLKYVRLLPMKVKITHTVSHVALRCIMAKDKIIAKWQQMSLYKKIRDQERRKDMNDFDRMKVLVMRKKLHAVQRLHERKMRIDAKREKAMLNPELKAKILAKREKRLAKMKISQAKKEAAIKETKEKKAERKAATKVKIEELNKVISAGVKGAAKDVRKAAKKARKELAKINATRTWENTRKKPNLAKKRARAIEAKKQKLIAQGKTPKKPYNYAEARIKAAEDKKLRIEKSKKQKEFAKKKRVFREAQKAERAKNQRK